MAYPHETDDAGVVTKKNVNADNQAGEPEKAQAVTGRANDTPMTSEKPAIANSTFAERAKARVLLDVHVTAGDQFDRRPFAKLSVMAPLGQPAQIPRLLTDALRECLSSGRGIVAGYR